MSPDAFAERVALASAWAALAPRLPGARGTDEAARVLHRLGEYPDAPPIVPLHLGMLAELRGDLKRAEVHYRQALQADPDTALALNNLAMLLVKQGRQLDEAASLADRLVKIDDDPNYLDTLAMAQAAQGLLEPAIRTIQRAVDADPTSVAWRIRLARLLSMDDRMEEARRVFDRVLAEGVSSQALPPELLEDYQMLRMALYAGGNG